MSEVGKNPLTEKVVNKKDPLDGWSRSLLLDILRERRDKGVLPAVVHILERMTDREFESYAERPTVIERLGKTQGQLPETD